MEPYYERDGIVLYHADCREVLASLDAGTVDITVTSPPYNTLPRAEFKTKRSGGKFFGCSWVKRAADGYEDNMPEPEYQKWLVDIVTECVRISRGLVWVNHKIRYRDGDAIHPIRFLPFPLYSEVVWARPGSMALNCRRFAPSHECFWGFGKPHYWNDSCNTLFTVWNILPEKDASDHPCAYPVELASRPIQASCPPGGIVLEPFLGSGTTAEAAWHLGVRCVAAEKHEDYCEIAAKRLDSLISQGRLFRPEPIKETQRSMFGDESP